MNKEKGKLKKKRDKLNARIKDWDTTIRRPRDKPLPDGAYTKPGSMK